MMALWLPQGRVLHLGQHGGGARWSARCHHLGTIVPEKHPDGRYGYHWRELPAWNGGPQRTVELGVLGGTIAAEHVPAWPICGDCWSRLEADRAAVLQHQQRLEADRAAVLQHQQRV